MNTEVWSISPDKPESLESYRDSKRVKIPLLIDADSETIKAYGVLNERQGSVPHPTVVIADRKGSVRFFHLDENFRQRPPVETLLEAVREIEASAAASE